MTEESVEMPYRYFVSYAHTRGFGCMSITRSHMVTDMRHVKAIVDLIASTGAIDPVVLSFTLFPDSPKELNAS